MCIRLCISRLVHFKPNSSKECRLFSFNVTAWIRNIRPKHDVWYNIHYIPYIWKFREYIQRVCLTNVGDTYAGDCLLSVLRVKFALRFKTTKMVEHSALISGRQVIFKSHSQLWRFANVIFRYSDFVIVLPKTCLDVAFANVLRIKIIR